MTPRARGAANAIALAKSLGPAPKLGDAAGMATLNSHTARALAEERVRELRHDRIGARRRFRARAEPAPAETARMRTPRVGAKPCAETSFALAATVRYLRRRVNPDRS